MGGIEAALIPVGQALLSGVLVGGVYGLLSIGFSLAFGVMRIVNFAHGDLVMYGMYVGVVSATFGVDPLYAIPFSFALMAVLGAAQYQLVYRRFVGLATLQQLLAAIGLGLVLQMLAQVIFGADTRSAPSMFSGQYLLIGPLFVSAGTDRRLHRRCHRDRRGRGSAARHPLGPHRARRGRRHRGRRNRRASLAVHQYQRLRARLRAGGHRRHGHGHLLSRPTRPRDFADADRDHRDHDRRAGQHRRLVPRRHLLRRRAADHRDAVEFRAAGRAALHPAAAVHRLPPDRHVRHSGPNERAPARSDRRRGRSRRHCRSSTTTSWPRRCAR